MLRLIKEDVDSFTAELITKMTDILDDNNLKHKEQSVISHLFTVNDNKPMYEIILQCLLLNKYKDIKTKAIEEAKELLLKNKREFIKLEIENKRILEQNILCIKILYNFLPI